jgi:hypothetical protein
MLQVFFGNDQIKVRQKAHLAIDSIITPDKELIRIEADGYEVGQLLSISSAVSLFSPSAIYLVESPSSDDIFKEDFMSSLEALSESTHTFIVIEQDLLAADKKAITKFASVVEEYKKSADAKFNPFAMADALAVRDKRSLWLVYQEAKANNLSAEEIIGTLWWQLKSIRLAAAAKSADEAGMKDYPYKKAKSALNTFKIADVEKCTRKLLKLYHDGHKGLRDLDIALEEWVLTL